MSRTGRVMTRIHRFAGLVFGAQALIWIVSGLFFTLVPIEDVRGEHLRKPVVSPAIDVSELTLPASLGGEPVTGIRLASLLGKPAIELRTASGLALHDAATGEALPALDMDTAKAVAEARWAGRGVIASVELVDPAPREAGRAGEALWRADFDGRDKATFWIHPVSGDIVAVRTDHWRLFDLFWGLHIMDWKSRETISSWWMKLFSFGALVMTLAGIWMLVDQVRRGRLFR